MSPQPKSVLVTNGLLRKSLAVVRALGEQGIRVDVGEVSNANPAAWSKHCHQRLRYPSPTERPDEFMRWLRMTLQTGKYDVFIPMDDDTMDIAVERQAEIKEYVHLFVPSIESYRCLRDKSTAVETVSPLGLNVPQTWQPTSIQDVHDVAKTLHTPVVVKARTGSGSRGFRIVENPALELVDAYQSVAQDYPKPMIQTYINMGAKIDVCLLMDQESRRVAGFVQKELRNYPHPHGPSTVQESIHNEALMEACTAIAAALHWQGILEFEFLLDELTGQLYFMEVNPRFWNSLYLAVLCGVDFPGLYYRLALELPTISSETYPAGVRCRSLLPSDLLAFMSGKHSPNSPPFIGNPEVCGRDDILSWSDPGPTFGFLLAVLRYGTSRKMWKTVVRR